MEIFFLLPIIAGIACAMFFLRRREAGRGRALAVQKIEAFHASSQEEACKARLGFDRGEIDAGYFAVHDPDTGRSLAMVRSGGRLQAKWWVLYEEYAPGADRHLASRLARHEAVIADAHPAAAKIRSFVEMAQSAPAKSVQTPPDPPAPKYVDPYEMPCDP